MTRTAKYLDDDDDHILRDGERRRVPLMLRDSARDGARARIVDASGSSEGLHRPGYRLVNDDYARDAGTIARYEYQQALSSAWRNPIRDAKGYGVEGAEGAACTVGNAQFPNDQGAPGHVVNGICVPDSPRSRNALGPDGGVERAESDSRTVHDARARALADYDRRISRAYLLEGK